MAGLKTQLQIYIARVAESIDSISEILGDVEKRLIVLERKVDNLKRPRLSTDGEQSLYGYKG